MATNWQSDAYKSAVAGSGGYFDSKGASTTKNTWGTEAVDVSKWQSGGWYTNPNTGYVEQWWSGSSPSNSSSSNNNFSSSTSTGTANITLPERPTIDLKSEYQSLYDSLGLANYKTQIEAKNQEILSLRSQTDDAIALINENPWASSANRTGRIAKLETAYQNKATLINAESALIQSQYESAMSELNTQMSLYTQQYNYDTANFDANVAQLNSLLDMGALDNASSESLQTIASQTGMTSDMISSMVQAKKNSKVNPTLIQNTDDYGNVTLTLIDANTGNLINQQTLSGVSGTSVRKTSSSGGNSSGMNDTKNAKLDGSILSIVSDIDSNYVTINGQLVKQEEDRVADNLLSEAEYNKALNNSYIKAKQMGYTGSQLDFSDYFANVLINNGYSAWG